MAYHRQMRTNPQAPQNMMTSNLDLNLSVFSETGMGYPMSLASNSYAFSSVPLNNPFSATSYNSGFLHSQLPTLSPAIHPPHTLPPVREARNGLSLVGQRLPARLEHGVTARPNVFTNMLPNETSSDAPPKTPPPSGDVDFGTDVDSLMRAIQTNSKPRPYFQQQQPTSHPTPPQSRSTPYGISMTSGSPRNDPRARKRYQCHLPTCAKSFFQKTHLEIHMRAHTGDKPFVGPHPPIGHKRILAKVRGTLLMGLRVRCAKSPHVGNDFLSLAI